MFVKKLCRTSKGRVLLDVMNDFEAAASAAEPTATSMDDYLKSWGLAMYIEKFKEHSIDIETLPLLSASDIKDLIPVIGHRAKLTTQINMLKNIITDAFSDSQNMTESENTDLKNSTFYVIDDSTMVLDIAPEAEQEPPNDAVPEWEQNKNCEVYKLLSSINEGKGLLLRFQETGLLDNAARRRLCNLIIKEELKDNPNKIITSSRLYQLAYEITQVFKKESSSVYFIPFTSYSPQQKNAAKGKLLDCYRRTKNDLKKSGVIIKGKQKRCRSASSSHSEPESPRPSNSTQEAVMQLQDPQESDISEKILWLKNCCDPWETVESYWTMSTKIRLSLLQYSNQTIQQYYGEFKALNQPGGIFLLLKDYKSLYPENDQKLTENWLLIRPKIIELAKKRSDAFLRDTFRDIEHEQNEEVMDLAAFMAIPFLMTTSNVSKTKSKSKRLWRPSKQEVLEGFITHVKSAAQIENTIARKIEKLREFDLTLQPCIIIVGPSIKEISARYIVVNNIRYEVTSAANAVDACFKIIFVLNAQYPAECANVWQFIQTALFELKTKYDKTYTTVNTLLTDLNIQRK